MKLEAIPGLEASVRVNGSSLHEYDDDSDEPIIPSKSAKYVEATSGASFSVHARVNDAVLKAPHPSDEIAFYLKLDGKTAEGKVGRMNNYAVEKVCFDSKSERRTDGTYWAKPYMFADLQTDDRPAKAVKLEEVSSLGEIMIECIWMRSAGGSKPIPMNDDFKPAFDKALPEKCLKGRAISHATKMGAATPCAPVNMVTPSFPYGDKPFATFVFKYRSKRDLQIQGVIERTPEPTPLEDRDPETLTADEARELVRRHRAREQDRVRVKREKRERSQTLDGGDDDDVEVSSASNRRKRQRGSTDSGIDVVDLTED